MVKRRGTAFASHQRGLKLHQSIDLVIVLVSPKTLPTSWRLPKNI